MIGAKETHSRDNHQSPTADHNFSLLALALPYATFACLTAISWQRWIEPYVDSGRELMVPWRLAHGERLWADVQFHHGPLGPYAAAIMEGLAGSSLPARTALCALVALLHLAGLHVLGRRWLAPWRAALATSVAVATAVFLRPGGWLFPFSFDAAIAVTALTWALVLATRASPSPADAGAGVCVLAALLARAELGLAGAAILGFSARRRPRRLVPLALAPLAAAGSGYAMLSLGIPRATLVSDGWLSLVDPPESFRNVYRAYAGLDRVGLRTAELLLAAIVLAAVGALLVAASWTASRLEASGRGRAASLVVFAAVAALVAAAAVRARPPAGLAGSLTLLPPLVRVVPVGVLAAAAVRLVRSLRGDPPRGALAGVSDAALWIAAVFAARLLLAAGYVGPYDAFFLPLPLVVAQVGLFGLTDRFASEAGRALPRLAAAALVVFALFRTLALTDFYRGIPWGLVRTPAGSLRLPGPVADATSSALAALLRLPPGATLAGFPESGFFNYVLGRRSPFRIEQFFPGHLDAAGEGREIEVLRTHPPGALLRANVLAVGEGTPAFGRDYLARLDAAARERFRTAAVFGPGARPDARIGDPQFFVEIALPARETAASSR